MFMYLEIEGGYRRKHWRGRIISSAGAELGQLAFELAGGRLALTAGSDELVIKAFNAAETHGAICLNSQPYAGYTVQKTGEIEVTDSDGVTVLVLLKDSFGRRRKWAYRQGGTLSQAEKYAAWGDLLISRHGIITSIVDFCHWIVPECSGRYPLLSAEDEKIVQRMPRSEQLLIIALAARYLCIQPHFQSTTSDNDLVNVASFVRDEKTGAFNINPDVFPARPEEKYIFNYPWAIGSIVIISIMYFIVLLFWDFPAEFTFRTHIAGPVIMFFLVNGVPLAWLLIHLMMEPIADNPKEERRLYEMVRAFSERNHNENNVPLKREQGFLSR